MQQKRVSPIINDLSFLVYFGIKPDLTKPRSSGLGFSNEVSFVFVVQLVSKVFEVKNQIEKKIKRIVQQKQVYLFSNQSKQLSKVITTI